MKIIQIKKSSILKLASLIIFIFTITLATQSFGMQNYYKLDFATGMVTATNLNVRSGPRYKVWCGSNS